VLRPKDDLSARERYVGPSQAQELALTAASLEGRDDDGSKVRLCGSEEPLLFARFEARVTLRLLPATVEAESS
jgi:hypothetical protein